MQHIIYRVYKACVKEEKKTGIDQINLSEKKGNISYTCFIRYVLLLFEITIRVEEKILTSPVAREISLRSLKFISNEMIRDQQVVYEFF